MAYVQQTSSFESGFTDRLATSVKVFFERVGTHIETYRIYCQTLTELEAMSDRELADLNLSRYDIHRVACEAACAK
ncbi:DUF1127 domain-containing protein [Tranquillimonas alkanivorans]|uniref:YjiS-like domain-containing protein n=1 Tax=Tranquillimonas alkanivorans TaxID=441119 RepID=A0A1I5UK73_9RHOB|nr:DUF1127 domain-containing protein [Tranquillimonas alkanivorans]SFP95635.1 protein of unknown function [Tranquillimonas alkanivorans]